MGKCASQAVSFSLSSAQLKSLTGSGQSVSQELGRQVICAQNARLDGWPMTSATRPDLWALVRDREQVVGTAVIESVEPMLLTGCPMTAAPNQEKQCLYSTLSNGPSLRHFVGFLPFPFLSRRTFGGVRDQDPHQRCGESLVVQQSVLAFTSVLGHLA
jgi:hypothetical protein